MIPLPADALLFRDPAGASGSGAGAGGPGTPLESVQEAVQVLPGDDEDALLARLHGVEHRLLPRVVAERLSALGGVDLPPPRRALVSVSDKSGLGAFARALAGIGFELVSTGGTARALRAEGLDVTDVADVTGFPEMLDGRVKTLHPRVHGGLLADRRRADHREALIGAGIAPFDLVVVNLYPFEPLCMT